MAASIAECKLSSEKARERGKAYNNDGLCYKGSIFADSETDSAPDDKGFCVLTKKGKYGLKAMVHLAGRSRGDTTLVMDIAISNQIPKKFLDTILGELRNAGLVNSKKGKGGGYALARPAHQIMVGHIIRVLDGPLAPIQCASKTAYRRCDDCTDEKHCSVRLMMLEARNAIAAALDNRTLAEMRALTERDDAHLMYYI